MKLPLLPSILLVLVFFQEPNTLAQVVFPKEDLTDFGLLKSKATSALKETELTIEKANADTSLVSAGLNILAGMARVGQIKELGRILTDLHVLIDVVNGGGLGDVPNAVDLSPIDESLREFSSEVFHLNTKLNEGLIDPEFTHNLILIAHVRGLKKEARSQLSVAQSNQVSLTSQLRDVNELRKQQRTYQETLQEIEVAVLDVLQVLPALDIAYLEADLVRLMMTNSELLERLNKLAQTVEDRKNESVLISKLLEDALAYEGGGKSEWETYGGLLNSPVEFNLSYINEDFTLDGLIEIEGIFPVGKIVIDNIRSGGVPGESAHTVQLNLVRYVTIPGYVEDEQASSTASFDVIYDATRNSHGDPNLDADFLKIPVLGVSVAIPEGKKYETTVFASYNSPLKIVGVQTYDPTDGSLVVDGSSLPIPEVKIKRILPEENGIRLFFDVANYDDFPDALFHSAPHLPPCGLNQSASRSWIQIKDQDGSGLYGFCNLNRSAQMSDTWLFLNHEEAFPGKLTFEILDRERGLSSSLNGIIFPSIISSAYQPDLAVNGRGRGQINESFPKLLKSNKLSRSRRTSSSIELLNSGRFSDTFTSRVFYKGRKGIRFRLVYKGTNYTAASKVGFESRDVVSSTGKEYFRLHAHRKPTAKRGSVQVRFNIKSSSFPWRRDSGRLQFRL